MLPEVPGRIDIPRDPPAFGQLRVAVREHVGVHGHPQVVGLSGGADSLALTAALAVEQVPVVAVVVDHQLQEGSGEVARRAAAQARGLGLEARVIAVEVPGGGEAAARTARYAALFGVGAQVAVGHTRDDQAETYLLGALRGNPAGMLPYSQGVHRPLLHMPRELTRRACRELGLEWWEDPHNTQERFKRVQVRQVLAGLDDAASVAAIAQAAGRAAQDRQAVIAWARQVDNRCVASLRELPAAVRAEALANLIRESGAGVKAAQVRALENLVVHYRGQGPVALGGKRTVSRQGGRLIG